MNKQQILSLWTSNEKADLESLQELCKEQSERKIALEIANEKMMELNRRIIILSQEIKDLDYFTDISDEEWAKYSPPKEREKSQLQAELEQLEKKVNLIINS